MNETFADSEVVSQSVNPSDDQPGSGYPPSGQAERLQDLANAETQALKADNQAADQLLGQLETEKETPTERQVRLAAFVAEHCADLNIPPDTMEAVLEKCQVYEDAARNMWADPQLTIGLEDVATVRENILPLVPAVVAKTDQLKTAEEPLNSRPEVEKREATEAQYQETISTIPGLQTQFENLRQGEGGTMGALQQLLDPGSEHYVDNPQIRETVQKVYNIAQALQAAVPDKPEVINSLLNGSTLNFAASQPEQIFAGFMAVAQTSTDLSQADRSALRQVLTDPRLGDDIRNGTDVRLAGRASKQITDPETGEVIGEEYLYTSQQNYAAIRPGVGTYMKGERQMLFLTESGKARDITGMSDQYVTVLSEVWAYFEAVKDEGATGFLEELGATHFDFMSDTAFDWLALRRARDIISKLSPGVSAGRDGRIANPEDHATLLRAQMRVLAGNEQALGMQSHQADTHQQLATLGLIRDGKPDWDVLEAFGAYSQEHFLRGFTRAQVQGYLHGKFPKRVAAPPKQGRQSNPETLNI